MTMTDRYEALKLKNQLCFPLYAVSKEIVKRYTPLLDKIGLTYTQYIAMMVLWEEREVTVKELGNRLLLDSGTITPVLKTLEKKGYVNRRRSQTDERVVYAVLTDEGLALREQAVEIPEKIGACIPLEPEDAANLYRILHTIMDRL